MTTKTKTTWRTVRLKDVADINAHSINSDFPHKRIEYIDISAVGSGTVSNMTEYELSEAPGRARRLVVDGDTILSTVRPNRRSFLYVQNSKENTLASTGFAVLSPKKETDSRFLYYLVTRQKFSDYLSANTKGSAYPAVSPEVISDAEVSIPVHDEQKRIADILSAFDEKIENNNLIIKALEEMAQAIFKERFAVSLDAIPSGWGMKKLGDFGKIVTGKTPSTKEKGNFGNDYPFITIPDLQNGVFVIRTERFLSEQGAATMYASKLPAGAICVSCIATIGLVGIATRESFTNQQINSIIPRSEALRPFLFLLLRGMKRNLQSHASGGTAAPIISKGAFEKIEIVMPQEKILTGFYESVNPMFEKILVVLEESQKLGAMRDLFLPRLMSGEIRV